MATIEAIRVLSMAMLSFFVAMIFTLVFIKSIGKLKVAKQIRSEDAAPVFARLHEKKAGTPTMGGIIIWATVAALAAGFWLLHKSFGGVFTFFNFVDRAETYLPLAALLIAAVLGLIDDILGVLRIGPHGGGLQVRHKLILYTAIALLGAWWFYDRLEWDVLMIPFWDNLTVGVWYIPIFIFIIVASAFSANETDGLDGLAGGVMLFALLALTVVSFALGRYHLATLGSALVGAILAFLWFNIYPARFFMGDTGSMALGITMGVIAMLTNTTLFLPFFAPILVIESLSVIAQLMSKKLFGKKIFLSTPIHHHFEAKGSPETQITMRFWIISAVFCALGLALFFLNRYIIM
jgi:phospho-N-acetylmuramoyl-pentapeptide-transferase